MGFWSKLVRNHKKRVRKHHKNAYATNTMENDVFLEKYMMQINAFLVLAEDNANVSEKLHALQDEFYNVVATSDSGAEKKQDAIIKLFKTLEDELKKATWDEAVVLHTIKNIRFELQIISSMRENI